MEELLNKSLVINESMDERIDCQAAELNCTRPKKEFLTTSAPSRPHSIEDMLCEEKLNVERTPCTFDLEDFSDDEDIWIMDVPKLINPQELRGQTITFGEKSKFKIKDERYCIVTHETNCNVTCVLKSGKELLQYKTVNIKPTGSLTVRRKLPGTLKIQPVPTENSDVQIPDNLKPRHPLFGVVHESTEVK